MKVEVGSRVKITGGYEGRFNGRIATVTEVEDDLDIMATTKEGLWEHKSEGDEFHYFFLNGEYEHILTIQTGKYYRTRDGEKVGPMVHDEAEWYTCGDGRLWNEDGERWTLEEYHNNIIAEWTEGERGTLASDTPKTWGEMTDAEKGELLLAWHQGKTIENNATRGKWTAASPIWADNVAYRIKQEPKRETVNLCGSDIRLKPFIAGHRITFDTIDGKPVLDSIKMEELG